MPAPLRPRPAWRSRPYSSTTCRRRSPDRRADRPPGTSPRRAWCCRSPAGCGKSCRWRRPCIRGSDADRSISASTRTLRCHSRGNSVRRHRSSAGGNRSPPTAPPRLSASRARRPAPALRPPKPHSRRLPACAAGSPPRRPKPSRHAVPTTAARPPKAPPPHGREYPPCPSCRAGSRRRNSYCRRYNSTSRPASRPARDSSPPMPGNVRKSPPPRLRPAPRRRIRPARRAFRSWRNSG